MHHLGVPTTRALSLIATGLEVRRPWYDATSADRQKEAIDSGTPGKSEKFPPNVMLREPGAIICRVSPSFLRVAQLELFAKRKEIKELIMLADYTCLREFPDLLDLTVAVPPGENMGQEVYQSLSDEYKYENWSGSLDRYVALYKRVISQNAFLVSEWLRVGYVQGNMNSDNTMLAGRTLDYGPYGWLEAFDPNFQPFTSDPDAKFGFLSQPMAMNVNVAVLGETIETLIKGVCQKSSIKDEAIMRSYVQQVRDLSSAEFQSQFVVYYTDMKRRKLGFRLWHDTDEEIWIKLIKLMYETKADYTLFFRQLSLVGHIPMSEVTTAFVVIGEGVFFDPLSNSGRLRWVAWLEVYLKRLQAGM